MEAVYYELYPDIMIMLMKERHRQLNTRKETEASVVKKKLLRLFFFKITFYIHLTFDLT